MVTNHAANVLQSIAPEIESSKATEEAQSLISSYERDGYAIIRNAVDRELLSEANEHLQWLARRYPDLPPEHYHHPLMRDDAFWVRLVTDSRLVDIAEIFLGHNIACFTAHYICKQPYLGQPVFWHQDGAYWNLAPAEALTVWLAIDESNSENGCLQVIPGSHKASIEPPELRPETPNMLYSSSRQTLVDEWIERSGITDVILQPGDVSIHHPNIIHGSQPNRSPKRRCGLDIGYISTSTQISNRDLYLAPFRNHREWNKRVLETNSTAEHVGDKETPLEITRRMIERLQTGTVK